MPIAACIQFAWKQCYVRCFCSCSMFLKISAAWCITLSFEMVFHLFWNVLPKALLAKISKISFTTYPSLIPSRKFNFVYFSVLPIFTTLTLFDVPLDTVKNTVQRLDGFSYKSNDQINKYIKRYFQSKLDGIGISL